MSELDQLRADLKVFERYGPDGLDGTIKDIRDKIARLEAEAASPWRVAKETLSRWRDFSVEALYTDHIVPFFDHLTAENERLAKRVAELEADPEFTPAVLKRSDEVSVGDVILAGGRIQTVTDIDSTHQIQRIIKCDGWMAWFYNGDLVAVLPKPLVEAKTLSDMQPPFEGTIVGLEPILDPARVLATAADICLKTDVRSVNAQPYRVKGQKNGG